MDKCAYKHELYIYGDVATRSGIIIQNKIDGKWQQEINQAAGKMPEINAFLISILKNWVKESAYFAKSSVKFITYNVPFMKGNILTSNKLSFLRGYYLGIVKGFLAPWNNIDVECYIEYETTVSKEVLGTKYLTESCKSLKRAKKKALTKALMDEDDQDLADAKMLKVYCQRKNQY